MFKTSMMTLLKSATRRASGLAPRRSHWMVAAQCALIVLLATAPVAAQNLSSSLLRIEMMQAKGGDPEAQFTLGARYEDGNGVEKNPAESHRWYSLAANAGHAGAQFRLGRLHELGIGVPASSETAQEWIRLAASNGHEGARQHLAAQERERVAEEARAAQRALATTAPRPAPRPAPAPQPARTEAPAAVASAPRPPAPEPEVRPQPAAQAPAPAPAAPEPAAPAMPDIRDVVVNASWSNAGTPALYLPSTTTSCVVSGEEVVCFSREQMRRLEGQEVTFITRTTLSDFNAEGSFRVSFIHNVVDLRRRGQGPDDPVPEGLRAERGWLDPAISLRCQAASRNEVRCEGSAGERVFLNQ
ncbi:tetratricopeptide repeat protein [Thioalkalivibrio sulfidiphilus]|uniref:Sel1 domain protein repeat-containing protein n=1 Tax=Thioalkalivibrio sulfidiphilus (strain HL-EbGR7) TaxID=396588 RepID=B8GRF5_THISH|nr:tetratricopeptide repeat protein [Thioalkalivibrio sulfidiphilus]ACL72509.1 Sel1 domain protein repeat-containing protein [Thioalkalivibrio sulfidiphilus HL-EbGr7]